MKEKDNLAFEKFLLQAGSDLFKRHYNEGEKAKGREKIKAHIKIASQFMQASDIESAEHTLALATLCHAYKALALYDWNWESKIDLTLLRQSIDCFTILGRSIYMSKKTKAYIAEQRLWLCGSHYSKTSTR